MTTRTRARRVLATAVVAASGASLLSASPASAERVTSLKPWKPTNTYLARADLDGRPLPRLNPVAKVNHVRAGQWIRVECQVRGQNAYGSNLWIRTNGLYVPDTFVKTYTDGFIRGVPRCSIPEPTPAPTPTPTPSGPSRATLAAAVSKVAFERVYGSNYRIYKERYPEGTTKITWKNNGCSVPVEGIRRYGGALPGGLAFAEIAGYYSRLFEKSCDRHDFGYRNYGDNNSRGLKLDPSSSRRERIDARFLSNMKYQCERIFDRKYAEFAQRQLCKEVADEFHSGVRLFGGSKF